MAEQLRGKLVVERIAADLAPRIEALGRADVVPTLAIVRMGERPDDLSYERTAKKRAESLGIAVRSVVLEEFAPQEALEAALHEVNHDPSVHGCLLFRPLPAFIDDARACEVLDPRKDIDGITLASLAGTRASHRPRPPRASRCSSTTACRSRAGAWWWWGAAWWWASRCP